MERAIIPCKFRRSREKEGKTRISQRQVDELKSKVHGESKAIYIPVCGCDGIFWNIVEQNILEGHGTFWNMVERCGSNKEVEHTWTVYDVHVGEGMASVRSTGGKGRAPMQGHCCCVHRTSPSRVRCGGDMHAGMVCPPHGR